MELFYFLAIPILTSILAPIALELVKRNLNKRKEEREALMSEDQRNDQIAADLRDELRTDNVAMKKTIHDQNREIHELQLEVVKHSTWESKFYALKKEKQHLEWELKLLKDELDRLREQFDEYVEVRERIQHQVGGE